MFCNNCGKEISNDAPMCVHCGHPIKPMKSLIERKWGTGAMVGLVIGSVIIPFFGIVFGIIGLTKEEKKGQGAALLVIGIITIVAQVIAQTASSMSS